METKFDMKVTKISIPNNNEGWGVGVVVTSSKILE